jgi:hypothetical protein
MSKRKKKEYDDDDGRVISPMNVDGMPWYTERKSPFGGKKKPKEEKRSIDDVSLTKQESRAMMGGVVAAALLVAGIFAIAGLLFILFCIYVWFD